MILLFLVSLLTSCTTKQKVEAPKLSNDWKVECHDLKSVKGDYCLHTKGTPKKTIWYFHGLGCTQDVLQNPGSCLPKSKGEFELAFMAGLQDTAVITISLGRSWLLDPFPPKEMATPEANTKTFYESIIPEIGSKLPKPWYGVGHSMGGHNLAELSISYPEIFERVVLAHPMIFTCDPWALGKGIKCVGGIFFVGAEFPEEKWKKRVDPLVRIKRAIVLPKTLVLSCLKDEFKLIDGPTQYVADAAARNLPAQLESYDNCNHFAPKASSVLEFLK